MFPVNGWKIQIPERIFLPFDQDCTGCGVYLIEQQTVLHSKFRVSHDHLSFQLKLHDGDRLVHFLIEHCIPDIIFLFPVIQFKTAARFFVITVHCQSRKRHQIDPISILQQIQIAVFCGDADHVADQRLIARCCTHPRDIMVSPLDINGMM